MSRQTRKPIPNKGGAVWVGLGAGLGLQKATPTAGFPRALRPHPRSAPVCLWQSLAGPRRASLGLSSACRAGCEPAGGAGLGRGAGGAS